jgi:hypothetical protein
LLQGRSAYSRPGGEEAKCYPQGVSQAEITAYRAVHWPTNAPFAELVRLSKTDIAEEMGEEHRRQVMGDQ